MSFMNQIPMVTQKLVDYSVHNSPTQLALQAMSNYGGGNRGPMTPGVNAPQSIMNSGQMAQGGMRAGGAGAPAPAGAAPVAQQGYLKRDMTPNGLLDRLIRRTQ